LEVWIDKQTCCLFATEQVVTSRNVSDCKNVDFKIFPVFVALQLKHLRLSSRDLS